MQSDPASHRGDADSCEGLKIQDQHYSPVRPRVRRRNCALATVRRIRSRSRNLPISPPPIVCTFPLLFLNFFFFYIFFSFLFLFLSLPLFLLFFFLAPAILFILLRWRKIQFWPPFRPNQPMHSFATCDRKRAEGKDPFGTVKPLGIVEITWPIVSPLRVRFYLEITSYVKDGLRLR